MGFWCASAVCGKALGADRKQCSKCGIAQYCGKDCQAAHWKRGGHKEACEAPTGTGKQDGKAEWFKTAVLHSETDSMKALEWYKMAADQGHHAACCSLAVMIPAAYRAAHSGAKVTAGERKLADALATPGVQVGVLRRAADEGHAEAMVNLGLYYCDHDPLAGADGRAESDAGKALGWFGKAAALGHAGGQYNMGLMDCTGKTMEVDGSKINTALLDMRRDKVVALLAELVQAIDDAAKHGESEEFQATIGRVSSNPLVAQIAPEIAECCMTDASMTPQLIYNRRSIRWMILATKQGHKLALKNLQETVASWKAGDRMSGVDDALYRAIEGHLMVSGGY